MLENKIKLENIIVSDNIKLEQLKENIIKINKFNDEIIILNKQINAITIYRELVDSKKGIPVNIINNYMIAIVEFVNNFIHEFTDNVISFKLIDPDENGNNNNRKKLTLSRKRLALYASKKHMKFNVRNLGAFETWLINIAFKTALNVHSYYSKSNVLFIDEVLDCIDTENYRNKLKDILTKLNNYYGKIIIISHREMSYFSNNNIIIDYDATNKVSKIKNDIEIIREDTPLDNMNYDVDNEEKKLINEKISNKKNTNIKIISSLVMEMKVILQLMKNLNQ